MNKNVQMMMMVFVFTTISFLTQAQTNQKYKLPAARTPYEKELMLNQHPQSDPFVGYGKTGIQMPDNVRYPGEFEESQAVAIMITVGIN
jgi:hypothetical protein